MTKIVSSNPKVVSVFLELKEIIIREGGFFHPEVRIVEDNGNLIVESSLNSDVNDDIFYVPSSCLCNTDDFKITLDGNRLVAVEKNENVTELHKKICELMLDLFNETKKISYHRDTFPLPLLRNPTALEFLNKKFSGIASNYKNINEKNDDKLLVSSFLKSRYLEVTDSGRDDLHVFMPFIDTLNHSTASPGYHTDYDEDKHHTGLRVKHSKSLAGSNECFVHYGNLDPMMRYFNFGYVEKNFLYIRSIPMTLNFPEIGKIIVGDFKINSHEKYLAYPKQLLNIKTFAPKAVKRDNHLLVDRLFIPSDLRPAALRRILEVLLIKLEGKSLERDYTEKLIAKAEAIVLENNIAYIKEMSILARSLESSDVPEVMVKNLKELSELQLEQLKAYCQNAKKLPLSYLSDISHTRKR
jgi:hypothetical protein